MSEKPLQIAGIAGDGIGKEGIPAGGTLLERVARDAAFSCEFVNFPWGCEFYLQTQRMMDEDWLDQIRNFDAIYLPNTDKNYLNDDRMLVNTFRIIFNSTFGSNYELLDEKLFWSTNKKPYSFNDVTQIIQEKNL